MWWLLSALALAGDTSQLQTIHELAWKRAATADIVTQTSAEPEVRAAIARALGQLQRADALADLRVLKADEDPMVQREVAVALGFTPGAAPALRQWLGELSAPKGLRARTEAEDGLYVRLVTSLGRQGDRSDIPNLVGALAEPWPVGVAAAEALGRFGRRHVEGAEDAVPGLVGALASRDKRVVRAVASGLGRIGLAKASPEHVAAVAERARTAPDGPARAWLYDAALSHVDPEQAQAMVADALADRHRMVRTVTLQALEADNAKAEWVDDSWLDHSDSWVRDEAVAALGRIGGKAAIDKLQKALEVADSPHREAWVLMALIDANAPVETERVTDVRVDAAIRAALAAAISDPKTLQRLALEDEHAPVRTAAASRLTSLDIDKAAMGSALLASDDHVVRQVAIDLLKESKDPKKMVSDLLPRLRVETHHQVLVAGFEMLEKLEVRDPYLKEVLDRAVLLRIPSVSRAARTLAEAHGVELRELPKEVANAGQVQLVLPDGTVHSVSNQAPVVALTARNQVARVFTTRGEFRIQLRTDLAPRAVDNFAVLVGKDFYDGVVFHRVVPGFVIQTGCPRGDGWGDPGWEIPDEVTQAPYTVGAVGMARSGPDTGGSQWFVTTGPTPHLEGDYTLFGYVVDGMAVVNRMERGDKVVDVVIERVDPR